MGKNRGLSYAKNTSGSRIGNYNIKTHTMSITKTRYSAASEAAVPDQDFKTTTMDVLKLEIACIKGNKWLTQDERDQMYIKLRNNLAPNMPEHVFQALLS